MPWYILRTLSILVVRSTLHPVPRQWVSCIVSFSHSTGSRDIISSVHVSISLADYSTGRFHHCIGIYILVSGSPAVYKARVLEHHFFSTPILTLTPYFMDTGAHGTRKLWKRCGRLARL
ncbi:hypothetical protein BJY01DRAFT_115542 [Aspergillus pseudoustus]|uniref:Secreted protein n=1 Tax=Aspergillus pseudoustus TaxID=1810923 RepID=A0ABR4KZU1_9EURO